MFLPVGVSLLALDCCGSGLSDGDYVTLGWHEQEDLRAVVEFLRGDACPFMIDKIALWGRSMGAVTSLFYAHKFPSAAVALVLDSPYSDLPALARELVGQVIKYKVPAFAVSGGLKVIRSSVKSRAGVDIEALTPISFVDKCFVPALFMHGAQDTFVAPHHSKALHAKYGGDKSLHIIDDGDHNSQRPFDTRVLALDFVCHAFGISDVKVARATASGASASSSTASVPSNVVSQQNAEAVARAKDAITTIQTNIATMLAANGVSSDDAVDKSFVAVNDVSLAGSLAVRDLKLALAYLKVSAVDCVEKHDLVSRLLQTLLERDMWRLQPKSNSATSPVVTSSTASTSTTTADSTTMTSTTTTTTTTPNGTSASSSYTPNGVNDLMYRSAGEDDETLLNDNNAH
jgi:dienelactone hydrolase